MLKILFFYMTSCCITLAIFTQGFAGELKDDLERAGDPTPDSENSTAFGGEVESLSESHDRKSKKLMIDGHIHFEKENLDKIEIVVAAMDRNRVDKAVLIPGCECSHGGPEGDDAVWTAYEKHSTRFYPCLDGFDPSSPDAPEYVNSQFQQREWRCIGEVYFRFMPMNAVIARPNSAPMMEIYKIAAEYNAPVIIHHDPGQSSPDETFHTLEIGLQELEEAVRENPETVFLWYHNCGGESGFELAGKYDNLMCMADSLHTVLSPDTIGFGSDIGCKFGEITEIAGTREPYDSFIQKVRKNLEQLPNEEGLLYQNLYEIMSGNCK